MTINNSGNGSVTVVTGSGNTTTVYNAKSIELADKAKKNFAAVASMPSEDGEVESITI